MSESSIRKYLDLCKQTKDIRDVTLRADTLGTFQALTGLWRIFVLQGAIAEPQQDATFAKILDSFSHVKQEGELFDAGRSGVDTLLSAAGKQPGSMRQEQMVELLVGKLRSSRPDEPPSPAENMLRVFDSQLLVPLDTLFALADQAGKQAIDGKTLKALDEQLSRLQETQSLHASLSPSERSSMSYGYWSEKHIEQERKLNIDKLAQ